MATPFVLLKTLWIFFEIHTKANKFLRVGRMVRAATRWAGDPGSTPSLVYLFYLNWINSEISLICCVWWIIVVMSFFPFMYFSSWQLRIHPSLSWWNYFIPHMFYAVSRLDPFSVCNSMVCFLCSLTINNKMAELDIW